jgi:glutamate-1-semialdehyde 2,1-aminomutase
VKSADRLATARQAFADRNPASRLYFEQARRYLPGGHTRTVLTHPPFPLAFASGHGATLTDLDGHTYVDLLGDYTAGLLGHSEQRVLDAVSSALRTNVSVGGVHPGELKLATLMCDRFRLDRVRFTNSGTEANLMAISTALHATGRAKVMVFAGGYHGGVLSFASGSASWNAPYDFVIAPYNDLAGAVALIGQHGNDLAAVLIEPMLGSGGCIPALPEFASGVFAAAKTVGAVRIADEVMTSRHGRHGLAELLGLDADITTFGKYIGGGFSFGAFGGTAAMMDHYDTAGGRSDVIAHAGTFNNNIATMRAGAVVLGEVFTPDVAAAHTARGEEFRLQVAAVLARRQLPMSVTGFGSMMSLHATGIAPLTMNQIARRDQTLQELVYLGLLQRGVYIAARGMINVGLAHSDDQLASALDALDETLEELADG